ncbi:MAG: hypothetical protein BAJATHORv1_20601 [Candidatus Thorarchaeota archaeon]|nr:MAG: hypothetical protein BAJATHORv1_20601 [Candidatus Thorarchaeota archaeon]
MPVLDKEYQMYREIIDRLLDTEETLSKRVVNRIKNQVCKKYGASRVPSNADVLQAAIPEELDILTPIMQKRPVRTVSGVAVVATMTKPIACPHGKCAYCPGGPDLDVPQSYTGHEPATMRGIQNDFDPYKQVTKRLDQLTTIGHSVQKVELIVMGGDWCSKEREYREWFVKRCLDAMNGVPSESLEEAKNTNETADVRNVGITFETRPDWVTDDTIDEMLEMGGTRVEIGVQTLSDEVLELVQRGHDVETTIQATKKLRDSGLKICYHMMPGLPSSSLEQDLETFEQLFSDHRFRPDMLKIYPTIVVKNTKLYEWWERGEYSPLTTDQVVDLVSRAVAKMPEYVRIQRMQRDIPLHQIEAGLDKGHLRELVHQRMKNERLRNPTIRFREIGHFQMRSELEVDPSQIKLVRRDYDAGNGTEVFLSYEQPDLDILFGFLRLRHPSNDATRPEIRNSPSVIIREVRVYGPVVDLGQRDPDAWQHLGLGEKMIQSAFEIGRNDFDAKQILVTSGIGVKEYYRKIGFSDKGPYLARPLSQ